MMIKEDTGGEQKKQLRYTTVTLKDAKRAVFLLYFLEGKLQLY
jgi:hypothetical protein